VTPFHIDKTDIDLKSIDQRLRQLMDFDRATSYAKQKDSLRKEFETFLASLPGHITLATVTPRDICRFLVFKDKNVVSAPIYKGDITMYTKVVNRD